MDKVEIWKRFINKTSQYERQMRLMMGPLFQDQEKEVLTNIDLLKYYIPERTKGRESSFLPKLADMIAKWTPAFLDFIKGVLKKEGSDVLDELEVGGNLNLNTQRAIDYINKNGLDLVKEINTTTREDLRKTLGQGLADGESIEDLKDRVKRVFDIADNSRARKIARTEVIRASNFGTNEAYIQSGVVSGKEWLTEQDDRTDEFCAEMDGKIIDLEDNFFDLGDSFKIGGRILNIDLFSVEYPPLHPNCRCTLIPV